MLAKKSLGQNFLKSESALREIINAGQISPNDFVLEIGPGRGALTEKILETRATVLAVEKDHSLLPVLKEKFADYVQSGKLQIIEEDILEFKTDVLPEKYKLIANIPYYITGAIIRNFLETNRQPETMVLLVQKEVAERIVARDGKESILSIAVKAYCEPKFIKTVLAGSFVPAPKVDSAIVLFENISKKNFDGENLNETKFFEIVREGFSHKRKILKKNLQVIAARYGQDINAIFVKTGIEPKARPEDLKLKDWFEILKMF